MVEISLECAVIGQAGTFDVTIDDVMKVSVLKNAIRDKKTNKLKSVDAGDLQLFLAKKGGKWLSDDDPGVLDLEDGNIHPYVQTLIDGEKMRATWTIKDVVDANHLPTPLSRQVHVLVVVPGKGKRCRADGWFGESFLPLPKKRKVDKNEEDINQVTRFFEMRDFPPLAHKKIEYKMVVERKAYRVIFTELMNEVQSSFEYVEAGKDSEPGKDSNLLVTGNPGIGKSRFYLYCIFQLILGEREDVKKLLPYELVLNYGTDFRKYDAERKEFVELDGEEVVSLQTQRRVLRLVEATSSQLVGWSGVSILFASPGVKGIKDFAKVDGGAYIMPAWTLEELRDYNSLLPKTLQLAEDDLASRYDIFGGIPRFIFTRASNMNGTNTLD